MYRLYGGGEGGGFSTSINYTRLESNVCMYHYLAGMDKGIISHPTVIQKPSKALIRMIGKRYPHQSKLSAMVI